MTTAPSDSIIPLAKNTDEPRLASVPLKGGGHAMGLLYLDGRVAVEWRPTDDERLRILQGESIRLWLWTDRRAAPAIHMEVTSEQKP